MEELKPMNLPETTSAQTSEDQAPPSTPSLEPKAGRKKSVPQISEEEMYQIIRDFNASGLTRRQFCLEREYPMSSFYYWQKKYYQKFPEELESKPGRTTTTKGSGKKRATAKKTKKKSTAKAKAKDTKVTTTKAEAKEATAVKEVKADVAAEPKKRGPGRPRKSEAEKAKAAAEKKAKAAAAKRAKAAAEEKAKAAPVAKAAPAKAVKSKAKAPVTAKEVETPSAPVFSGPYMQIRYPNGIRINVPADIDIKRLKELVEL